MQPVILGRSGLSVSPLIFGTLPLGPLQANLSPAEGGKLIRHALEQGVNMLDTAALYGTFSHIRAALEGFSGPVSVVSKTHAADAATAREHVETALREIGRERLELVHVHAARIAAPFVERAAVLEELLRLQEQGKIAHVGLSTHYVAAVREAARHPEIAVVHPLINRTGMGIIDGSAAEMAAAIAACAAAGTGIYAMKALAGGNLISSARESIAWVRQQAGVQALAIGMLSTEEIDANVRLFSDGSTDPVLWGKLEGRRRQLKIMSRFCKGCGKCLAACASQGLRLEEGVAVVDEEQCVLCGYCAAECPDFIIRVV